MENTSGLLRPLTFRGHRNNACIPCTILGFVFIALEAFKIIFRITVNEGADLTLISFQICSIPMYLLPCIYFMKDGKLKQAFR